jgi:hypothetical protein
MSPEFVQLLGLLIFKKEQCFTNWICSFLRRENRQTLSVGSGGRGKKEDKRG